MVKTVFKEHNYSDCDKSHGKKIEADRMTEMEMERQKEQKQE